jgi:hypothetical protein
MKRRSFNRILASIPFIAPAASFAINKEFHSTGILVEAERFTHKGGWVLDSQFFQQVGGNYLLAHGLGKPVENARTEVEFPEAGEYRMWVRSKNWCPGKWDAPGRFQVILNGKTVGKTFGEQSESEWGWESVGTVNIDKKKVSVELQDQTGFAGRCDAIYFSKDAVVDLPNKPEELIQWKDELSGRATAPVSTQSFDLVVVGGGIAGCAAAIAAEKSGLKVALLQDRPLFGGNASSEIRVHTEGIHGKGAAILEKLDTKHWPNSSPESMLDDEKRQRAMDEARGITQFLNYRACGVKMRGSSIVSVDARLLGSGNIYRFTAPTFIDCTGDGWLGFWAGAKYSYGRESKHTYKESWDKYGELWSPEKPDNRVMGSSVMWTAHPENYASDFPEVPWALPVAKTYTSVDSEWFWEYSSNDRHQIHDGEAIRDHMFRAIYGTFYNTKQDPANATLKMSWVAHILGKRESRRLVGDYIYTMSDAVKQRQFKDTVVEETRAVDVHYQKSLKGYIVDFISEAMFWRLEPEGSLYYLPFRSLYSINIDNLMMAGRCFSCSHVGLGGPRVQNTTGQMGIATGYAAALCKKYDAQPRDIYKKHIVELRKMIGYEDMVA